MAEFVVYQDVQCVYPMSGQYGRSPRVLYYALLLFIVLLRQQTWLSAGVAAACLITGGSAAVHAFILATQLSIGKAPVSKDTVSLPNATTIDITVLAIDLDSDGTLAVVGTGFLLISPMALWSAHFRHSGAEPILVLWMLLMTIGMMSCVANFYAFHYSAAWPLRQFRFCSLEYNDTLPFSGDPTPLVNSSWNDTIWSYFANQDPSLQSCIYPCLSANELLRQAGDAQVVHLDDIKSRNPLYWGMSVPSAFIYLYIPISLLIIVALFVRRFRNHRADGFYFDIFDTLDLKTKHRHFTTRLIYIYDKILTPFMFVMFLFFVEWIISFDLQSEPPYAVGQWAPIVGVALWFIAALVGKYWPKFARFYHRYYLRRALVVRHDMDECAMDSVRYIWNEQRDCTSRGAWSQAGQVFLQGAGND